MSTILHALTQHASTELTDGQLIKSLVGLGPKLHIVLADIVTKPKPVEASRRPSGLNDKLGGSAAPTP